LDRYGIPFFYELPTAVVSRGRRRTWHPDFTLPGYGDLIIEYAGMPDRPEYVAGLSRKRIVYAANHLPALFIYPRDIHGRGWPKELIRRIDSAGRRALAYVSSYRCAYRRY
jgi:hypothetical protein